MAWNWSWLRAAGSAGARREEKSASAGGFIAFHRQGEAHWTRRDYATLAREGFMRNPVAHRAVRMIAESAAAVPWLVYEGEREIEVHPLVDLLARPNARMGGPDFFEALYGHLMLSGNAYVQPVLAAGRLREVHLLRPDRVSVVAGADGWPIGYDYRIGNAVRRFAAEPAEGLGLLHLKLFHPLDDHIGFPPLAAAQTALDLHNAAATWNKALLDNSARPSGALVYQPKEGGNLSPDQYERLKAELENGYAGAVRAGRPLLLEGGLDWKTMSLSPRDMDFIEARNGARVLVVNVMGRLFMDPLDDPFAAVERELSACPLGEVADAVLVDVHAEATSEKQAMAYFLDGRASLVVGTHTHAPTSDTRILPGGTAYQSDAGMCGDYDSVLGMQKDEPVRRFLQKVPGARLEPATGEGTLSGVAVEIDDATGLARAVWAVRVGPHLSEALPGWAA